MTTLDLSDRPGISLHDVIVAFDQWQGERPDRIVLNNPGPPFITKQGRWGSFRGVPIVYVESKS